MVFWAPVLMVIVWGKIWAALARRKRKHIMKVQEIEEREVDQAVATQAGWVRRRFPRFDRVGDFQVDRGSKACSSCIVILKKRT